MQFASSRHLLRRLLTMASHPRLDPQQVAEVSATFVRVVADPDVPGMVRIGVRTTEEHSWTWTQIEALAADLLAEQLRQEAHLSRQQLRATPPRLLTPDLLGFHPKAAVQTLAAQQLQADVRENLGNESNARVVEQWPPPSTPIKPGACVRLSVSFPDQSSDAKEV